jgi:hypothetical protein
MNDFNKEKLKVDLHAISLIQALMKSENSKQISLLVKKLNSCLEENQLGYVFQLIDCMNLLGVATFYLEKYS